MISNAHIQLPLYLGIDGGGTKCRALLYCQQRGALGVGVAGRANPLHGLQQTFDSITQSALLALADAGLAASQISELIVGAGLAGVNVPRLFEQVIAWQHPFKVLHLTTDLHTACLGAHGGEDGAVIITGTGSCGYAHMGDRQVILGGHGFALGDKGSGAWLGLKAAEHVLLALDGFAEPTSMTPKLLDFFDCKDAMGIVGQLAGQCSSAYAKLSHIVFSSAEEGDEVALAIVHDGAGYINQLARKLLSVSPSRFAMIGGLAEPLHQYLASDVTQAIKPIVAAPEMGAVMFAQYSENYAGH
ncbi:N-acetylglucosamine kinase [Shewanella sp. NIFS-20-20]|uniref:N-acetylglucosamine kinase n=1 Tax=Shewanella sp. NIFS-20-20 TaxID=2853806 RepID=UPI001C482D76|nr:BadF/BadG/BcrA/BcrD ATPase family protein [Shewanella sp. NIFS-20-20]MBV7315435.1 ATPase [Shewanella sp. NIFS-20-20]